MIDCGAHRLQRGEEAVTGVPRLCLLLVAFLLLAPLTAQAQQTKLRITLQLPITNHLGVNLMQFKEEVERRTNTSIAVEIFDSSRLYKDNEALEAVASGAIEMATL